MNRQDLIAKVRQLADEAKASDELAAASILLSLAASLYTHSERELINVCAAHSQMMLTTIEASRN